MKFLAGDALASAIIGLDASGGALLPVCHKVLSVPTEWSVFFAAIWGLV